ncbi:MAG: chemotaxis protein CheA [Deltaproteobacteria bacterium]|nr:chemotaxis protein CheA [Deltaproteobacteria bacterium]MBW2018939.1 chemotaxis protein CheA [Deltaproteobacteria bacterium]MBW2073154.1 chemotaxis protein CheA [Deltaproteobacteria bacterium]RLB83774.1 MAG: chemotaxis protein CheA [Deltaproteobacteria bacterium]
MEGYLNTVKELLDKLALEVVMLEPDDVQGFGVVLNRLDEVIGVSTEAGEASFANLGRAIKSIAEKLVLGEVSAPEEGIKQIEKGVSLFQEVLRDAEDGKSASERIARFLVECGISDTDGSKSEAGGSKSEDAEKAGETMPDIDQDRELVESFIIEALEHLGNIEVNVLALEQDPENREVIDAIFRPFHTIKGVSGFLNLSDINRLAHEVETLLNGARNQKLTVDETLTDTVLDAVDLIKAMINHLKEELDTGVVQPADFGLEAFLDRLRRLQAREVEKVQTETAHVLAGDGADAGKILIEKGGVAEPDVAKTLEKQKELSGPGKKLGELRRALGVAEVGVEASRFVKVDTQKLDNMVDMVGELVITQAMLGQDISGLASQNKKLYTNLGQLRRITSEIQRISMSMRMIPIRQTFQKMIRLVRDLSRKSGKQVSLEMTGEETEIDRNMVDEIYDPLVHMVRNSVDHGIEKPNVRKAKGKPEVGTLKLKAYHKGGNIVIEISDDGGGLDRDKIIEKAIERNVIRSGENMTDQEVYSLILQPGFSTADVVTDVSGRGVGMDVVKRALDKMRGSLDIHSVKDQGTTILMKLPLTLAIIDGVMVRAGDRNYIIPTVSVVESLRPDRADCTTVVDKGEMVKIRENLYPLIRLHELFDFEPAYYNPWEAIVVVVESDGRRKCILVDELVGKQEIVIKSLGEQLKRVQGMAGGAILADGRVGLILDVPGLFTLSEGETKVN